MVMALKPETASDQLPNAWPIAASYILLFQFSPGGNYFHLSCQGPCVQDILISVTCLLLRLFLSCAELMTVA